MRKSLVVLIVAIGGGTLAAIVGGGYLASRHVPGFYEEILEDESQAKRESSDELIQQLSDLTAQAQAQSAWRTRITEQQINSWLAVDAVENHPNLLPPDMRDLRIHIKPQGATIACRYNTGGTWTVLSMEVDLYLLEPDVLALRVSRARAGMLPLPLSRIVQSIEQTASQSDWRLRWLQDEGDPVAVIPLPKNEGDHELSIETLELRDGEIIAAGQVGSRVEAASADQSLPIKTTQR